jgi:hypothetical protein
MNRAVVGLLATGILLLLIGAFHNGLSLQKPPSMHDDPFAAAGDRFWRRVAPIIWRVGALILVAVAFGLVTEVVV